MKQDWTIRKTRVFDRNYASDKFIVVNRGGTRSSKTYSICQQIFLWLLTGQINKHKYIPKGICSIVRRYGATHSKAAFRDFLEIYYDCPINHLIEYSKGSRTFVFEGRTVEFFGADDDQKVRGPSRNILFCNEANELHYNAEFFQLMIRTRDLVIIDFNPDDEYVWIKTELEDKRAKIDKDVEIIVSTYKDNQFLPARMVDEIERLERTSPMLWKVYGLGEYGSIEGLVFDNYEIHGVSIDELNEYKLLGYGLDFGYSIHPTALIEIREHEGSVYLRQLLYQTDLNNQQIAEKLKELGIERHQPIIADSAEPKSIDELVRAGYRVIKAQKGPDSKRWGLNVMRQYKLMIDANSQDLVKEFRSYRYAQNRNGELLDEPIKDNDHAIDAARYGITYFYGKPKGRYSITF